MVHHRHFDAAWQIFFMFIAYLASDPEKFGNYTSPTW